MPSVGIPISDVIKEAPVQPGCYLFKDKHDHVIYVGKEKNLRNRVKSYFTAAAADNWRTAELVQRIADVEYTVTESELDALLLEYRLIKQYKPWHNSQMKPDKQRPYLRVSHKEQRAAFSCCEQVIDDGADYYDFFIDVYDVERTLALLCKAWGVPQCGRRSFRRGQNPCIYHSTDGCMAPCSGNCDLEKYAAATQEVTQFLCGKTTKRLKELKRNMRQASDNLEFESAARYKSLLDGLEQIRRKSTMRFHLPECGEMLVLIRPHGERAFSGFYISDRRVVSRTDFPALPDDAMISSFLTSFRRENVSEKDSEWIAAGLVEVGAYKPFITLPDGKGAARVIDKAVRRFIKYALNHITLFLVLLNILVEPLAAIGHTGEYLL
jgi:excinuclease ABC subunit C